MVVGLVVLPSIAVAAVGEGSGAVRVLGMDFGCGGRWPKRTAETAKASSLPSAYRVCGSLRKVMPMSSRTGAEIFVDSGAGAWLMCASATETEESPEKGRSPANIS